MLCLLPFEVWDATATKSRTPHPEKQWATNQIARAIYHSSEDTASLGAVLETKGCQATNPPLPQLGAVRLHRSGLPRVWLHHNTGSDFRGVVQTPDGRDRNRPSEKSSGTPRTNQSTATETRDQGTAPGLEAQACNRASFFSTFPGYQMLFGTLPRSCSLCLGCP